MDKEAFGVSYRTFNRTTEELKYIDSLAALLRAGAFNRTTEELKCPTVVNKYMFHLAFNRTTEELK